MTPLSPEARAYWTSLLRTLPPKQRTVFAALLRDKHGTAPA